MTQGGRSEYLPAFRWQTTTVLASFLLAMIRYPDIHKKAQEEVDRVVGRQRLPDLDDRLSLPYVECILKEIYR